MSRVGPDFSVPPTPGPGMPRTAGLENGTDVTGLMSKVSLADGAGASSDSTDAGVPIKKAVSNPVNGFHSRRHNNGSTSSVNRTYTTHNYENPALVSTFQAKPGYKQWVAQAGTLVADLLTCAGADHVVCRSPCLSSICLSLRECASDVMLIVARLPCTSLKSLVAFARITEIFISLIRVDAICSTPC
jgi:hypothetical protein